MNKKLVLVFGVCSALTTFAAVPMRLPQNHVPETLKDVRPFCAEAVDRPHMLLINVSNAVDAQDWDLSATYAASRLQLNIWTNSVSKLSKECLLGDVAFTSKLFQDPNAKIGIYFVNEPTSVPVIAAPGSWAIVNVSEAYSGSPTKQLLRDRLAKIVLKGIAAAGGGGHTVEPFCSMFYRSRSLQGLDSVNIMLSPMCYFPMLEVLRSVGGDDMTMPAYPQK